MVTATEWLMCGACQHKFQGDNRICPECGEAAQPVDVRGQIPGTLRRLPSGLRNALDKASFGPIRVLRDMHKARHEQASRSCNHCGEL